MYSSITIAEIRRRINALKRKLALPYAVVSITRLADDYASKCSTTLTVSPGLTSNPWARPSASWTTG